MRKIKREYRICVAGGGTIVYQLPLHLVDILELEY